VTSASVVVNNFNYGRFLPEAIDSALRQTHQPTEVVVVDDGSTDDSRAVIARYGAGVRPVLKDNGGQGSAVNAGFAACTGDVVCFLDADDLMGPSAVASAVRALAAARAAKAHWPLRITGADGADLGRERPHGPLAEGDLRALLASDGPDSYCTPPMSGTAYTRRALERTLPMPEPPLQRFADGWLSAIAPLYGTVVSVPEAQGSYRVHGANHSAGAFDATLEQGVAYARVVAEALAARCEAEGLEAQVERWDRRSFYPRLQAAVDELDAIVPPGTPFILLDDGAWGMHGAPPRRARPLVSHDGVDWGPPLDDAHAVEALERHRAEGARFLVLGWPAFWWRETYTVFLRHVATRHAKVADDDVLLAFDLTRGP